jgi:hypothetical protein
LNRILNEIGNGKFWCKGSIFRGDLNKFQKNDPYIPNYLHINGNLVTVRFRLRYGYVTLRYEIFFMESIEEFYLNKYAALGMENTVESIRKYQMKFLQRAQNNEYLHEFLQESRAIVNNEGMIGQLIMKEGWKYDCNLSELNKNINEKLSEINMKVIDRLWFNEEAQRIKSLLNLKNNYLKIFKLNQMLHYSTYGNPIIEPEISNESNVAKI